MADDKKINRRKFIVGSGGALVGAAALGGELVAIEKPEHPATPSFRSPAGEQIPFPEAELRAQSPVRSFTGAHLNEIAFPLGGIGTGTISLGGRGELRDWEIFNRPGKGRDLPYTFFAVYAEAEGVPGVARVLERRLQPPYTGQMGVPTRHVPGLTRRRDAA